MHLMSFDRMSGVNPTKNFNTISAVLDIGSDKIVCLIAKNTHLENHKGKFELLGLGHQRSSGFERGSIVDPSVLELSIRKAIEDAEKMSSLTIDKITVNITSDKVESNLFEISIPINDTQVTKKELDRALSIVAEQNFTSDKLIFETIPLGFSIDGVDLIEDPIGMYGEKLNINLNNLTCSKGIIQNIQNIVESAHVKVERIIFSPIASAVATLSSDEANLGSIVIDMGAGTTSYSIFSDNIFRYAGVVPYGGNNITIDIARSLSISLRDAEKLKILYGGVLTNSYDSGEVVNIKQLGYQEDMGSKKQIQKSTIADISRTSALDTLERVKVAIENISPGLLNQKRVILTGGGSQLIGIDDLAGEIFQSPVRRAIPKAISQDFDISDPIFSNACGMLTYSQNETFVNKKITTKGLSYFQGNNFFSSLMRWFKDNF